MAVEITPEPSEAERQAIMRALGLERAEADEPTPWRRVGLGTGPKPTWAEQAGSDPRATNV